MALEGLETRALLATDLGFVPFTLNGTAVPDTILLSGTAASLTVTLNGTETEYTNVKDFKVFGLGGNDLVDARGVADPSIKLELNGGAGVDTVYGGAGDDLVVFDWGVWQLGEVLDGGAGSDRLELRFEASALQAALATPGAADLLNAYALAPAGATLDVTADPHVSLKASGFERAPILVKYDGVFYNVTESIGRVDNVVIASDSDLVTQGTDGNDVIIGTNAWGGKSGKDVLNGGWGDDLIIAGTGDDQVDGGYGDDVVYGGAGNDVLNGGPGVDKVFGQAGDDLVVFDWGVWQLGEALDGGAGNDRLELRFEASALKAALATPGAADLLNAYALAPAGAALDVAADPHVALTASGFERAPILVKYDGVFYNVTESIGRVDDVVIASDSGRIDGTDGNDVIIGTNAWGGKSGKDVIFGGKGDDLIIAGSGDDTIYGREGDDVIYGGDGNDLIQGEAGDDVIYGQAGDDTIYGGPGVNYLDGGDGDDRITGGDSGDQIFGRAGHDTLIGGAGDDTILGEDGDDKIYGRAGDDFLDGGDGSDVLNGEAGNDAIYGRAGDDTINGGAGVNYLDGGGGDDRITGGADVDTIYGGAGDDYIVAGAGHDVVDGGAGADTIYGQDGDDTLYGGAGDGKDTILGGNGADSINGGGGPDTIKGEAGDDTIVFDWVVWQLGEVIDGGAGSDRLELRFKPENLKAALATPGAADLLNAYALAPAGATLNVTAGPHVALKASGFERAPIILEHDGVFYNVTESIGRVDDVVIASDSDLVTQGTDGNDVIIGTNAWGGKSGRDVLNGGWGDDLIIAGSGDDVVDGGYGDDVVYGGAGNDVLNGGPGVDKVFGQAGDDLVVFDWGVWQLGEALDGGAGNDRLKLRFEASALQAALATPGAADLLNAYALAPAGATLNVTAGPHVALKASGFERAPIILEHDGVFYNVTEAIGRVDDVVIASDSGLVFGTGANDVIIGTNAWGGKSGKDFIFGRGGDDLIIAGTGDDIVVGGPGKDVIHGGQGFDLLIGGSGADSFFDDLFLALPWEAGDDDEDDLISLFG